MQLYEDVAAWVGASVPSDHLQAVPSLTLTSCDTLCLSRGVWLSRSLLLGPRKKGPRSPKFFLTLTHRVSEGRETLHLPQFPNE